MINNCLRDPSNYQSLLAMAIDNTADLIFQQSVEYKNIELYRCHFEQADEDSLRSLVSYKFRLAHFNMTQADTRLKEVASIIKAKNPSLLTQIQNGATAHQIGARANYTQY